MGLKKTRSTLRYYGGFVLTLAIFLLGVSSLSAQSASSIAQGFQTDDPNVVAGAIVGLKEGPGNAVELSSTTNADQVIGVVGDTSLIELSGSPSSVQIVTNGNAVAFVSDINGPVKIGDRITTSPVKGVGMKATESVLVIATAQADLSSVESETRTITDKSGKKQTVHIGAIPVQVDKVFYEVSQASNSFLPPVLQDFANNDGITGACNDRWCTRYILVHYCGNSIIFCGSLKHHIHRA
jgi:hypothetical protein